MKDRRGFSLIEVMVAAAILGMAATALFGLFSKSLFNLRKIQDVHQYQLAAEEIMNRVLLLPNLPPGANLQGSIDRIDASWNVNITPWFPRTLDASSAEAVMKIDVEISWSGQAGPRNLKLETLKPTKLVSSNFDFQRAVETVLPDLGQ